MSAWSAGRQAVIITYIILIGVIAAAVFYFLFVYQSPSCFDNIQNGLEEGIDCGGGCQLVCPFAASEPNIAWARAFEIAPGVYNLAAEVENPNFTVGTNIDYTFRAYNEANVLVAEINNQMTLYPTERRVVFEPAVETGNRSISRVFFEFGDNSGWYNLQALPDRVVMQDYVLRNADSLPSLEVNLRNTDIRKVGNLVVTAVLYNAVENVEQVSQTLVDGIEGDSTQAAFFSWRDAFVSPIQTIEIFVQEIDI